MKLKHAIPGMVWIAVGAAVLIFQDPARPLLVRGTKVSWGLVVIATGVVIALYGLIKKRKQL